MRWELDMLKGAERLLGVFGMLLAGTGFALGFGGCGRPPATKSAGQASASAPRGPATAGSTASEASAARAAATSEGHLPFAQGSLFAGDHFTCRITAPGEHQCWGRVIPRLERAIAEHQGTQVVLGDGATSPTFCVLNARGEAHCEKRCPAQASDVQCRFKTVGGVEGAWRVGGGIMLLRQGGEACVVESSQVVCAPPRQASGGGLVPVAVSDVSWSPTRLADPVGVTSGLLLADGRSCHWTEDERTGESFLGCQQPARHLERAGRIVSAAGRYLLNDEGQVFRVDPPKGPAKDPMLSIGIPEAASSLTPLDGFGPITELVAGWRTGGVCAYGPQTSAFCEGIAGWRWQSEAAVKPLAGLDCMTTLAVGEHHVCAQSCEGEVRCAGSNQFYGALGFEPAGDDFGTHELVRRGLRQLSTGATGTCALDGQGRAWCWGGGRRRPGDLRPARHAEPYPLSLPGPAQSIEVGREATCALLLDERVACWRPRGSAAVVVAGLPPVQELRGERDLWCARSGAQLHCWGSNQRGELGLGHKNPTEVPTRLPALDGVVDFDVGEHSGCAVHHDGTLSCWGAVDGIEAGRVTRVASVVDAVEVALSDDIVCYRTAAGGVSCFESIKDEPVAVAVGEAASLEGLGSREGMCVLRSDRTLNCWSSRPKDFVEALNGFSGVDELSANADHACVRQGSTVTCLGPERDIANGELLDSEHFLPVPAQPYHHVCGHRGVNGCN